MLAILFLCLVSILINNPNDNLNAILVGIKIQILFLLICLFLGQ